MIKAFSSRSLAICLLGLGLAGCSMPTTNMFQQNEAQRILVEIRTNGPAATARQLWSDGRMQTMLAGVASADPQWLDVAKKIRLGTDANTARGLTLALSKALTVDASGVMELIDSAYSANHVCAAPFMFPSREQATTYFSSAIANVEAIPADEGSKLHVTREVCLYHLRADREMAMARL